MFVLFNILAVLGFVIIGGVLLGGFRDEGIGPAFMILGLVLYCLGSFIPNLAVQVRRLHDQNKSGWFMLLSLVPLGGIVLLIFMFIDGTAGPNRFGPDPKAAERHGITGSMQASTKF